VRIRKGLFFLLSTQYSISKNKRGILEQFSDSPSEMSMFFKGFAVDLVDIFVALNVHKIYIRTMRN